ncbi:hypothetical protein E4T56_gene1837 [Termitomyces sp. T112]|nr:hypothetical protein E4T56_gene1837 [Termitomyces sp. T112]
MTTSTHLLHRRRFLPLFATHLLGAFNDNLYKKAAVFFVVYGVFNSEKSEAIFSAVASALFIVPFFILSALAGQLADMRDKAQIIRWVKLAEIGIMIAGGAGLVIAWQAKHGIFEPWQDMLLMPVAMPLILLALLGMGIHSTFFGPIKYAILPQHLKREEVLAGTGLVEAGTYIAILAGTILAGFIPVEWAAAGVFVTALVGYATCLSVPPAPPQEEAQPLDFHILRASVQLLFLDRGRGAVHRIPAAGQARLVRQQGSGQPLPRDLLDRRGAGLGVDQCSAQGQGFGALFAAFGAGDGAVRRGVSAGLHPLYPHNRRPSDEHHGIPASSADPDAAADAGRDRGGGRHTARTIAANNVVNSGAMVVGAAIAVGLGAAGVEIVDLVLISAAMCLISAWLAVLLADGLPYRSGDKGHHRHETGAIGQQEFAGILHRDSLAPMTGTGDQRVRRGMGLAADPVGGLRAHGLRRLFVLRCNRRAAGNWLAHAHMMRQRLQKGMMGALVTQNQRTSHVLSIKISFTNPKQGGNG